MTVAARNNLISYLLKEDVPAHWYFTLEMFEWAPEKQKSVPHSAYKEELCTLVAGLTASCCPSLAVLLIFPHQPQVGCIVCFIYDIYVCFTCICKASFSCLPEDRLLSNGMNTYTCLHNTVSANQSKAAGQLAYIHSCCCYQINNLGEEGPYQVTVHHCGKVTPGTSNRWSYDVHNQEQREMNARTFTCLLAYKSAHEVQETPA